MVGMDIDVILFDGFDELDAIAPFEILRNAEAMGADLHPTLVGAHGAGEIAGSHGTRVVVDRAVSETAGLLVVPGGGWNAGGPRGARGEVQRGDLPALLLRAHAAGSIIAAVCTGGMILAAAGLTRGRRATTHHLAVDALRASGADVVDARVVDDGDIVTCGGVTSGIDLALWLVERFAGREIADRVTAEIEHERAAEVARA
jgi:transcriptional regulator GlxA family with amidase domain